MIGSRQILYQTIAEWELQERFRRQDPTFNGWEDLAHRCGLKHASTLRNMCIAKSESNSAKLGWEQAFVIMCETQDYRLIFHMRERLKETKRNSRQTDLFSQPIRSLEE